MNILDHLRMSGRALLAQKMRAVLAALGIVIGVAAVIGLLTLGQAASGQVATNVQGLGANLITVIPARQSGVVLYPTDAQWLQEVTPQISADAPVISGGVEAQWKSHTWSTSMLGTTPDYARIASRSVAFGRFLTPQDLATDSDVAVIGYTTAQQLFVGQFPLGQTITVNGTPLTVVGVLSSSGGSGNTNSDDEIIAPVGVAEQILGTTEVSSIVAEAKSAGISALAVGQIEAVLNHRFNSTNAATVVSQDQIISTLSQVTSTLSMMLSGIAGISLLVGGIGIMNIMLVNVAERTPEIGLRMAIGAPRRSILWQFLIEATALCLGGGLLGSVIGAAGGAILESSFGWAVTVNWPALALALGFSFAVGIVFGVWPALTASRLDPVVALRRM